MFIGREYELQTLEDLWDRKGFQFIPIYGRRRVGKTSLIERFAEGKRSIIFTAVPGKEEINLSLFNQEITGSEEPVPMNRLLEKIEEISNGERLLLVIDEYPNLIQDAKHIPGMINNFIERYKDTSNIFLILCGSSMSVMENEVLGKKSPLYGRRTGQIKLHPFSFRQSLDLIPYGDPKDQVEVYGLVGGIPYYLEQFDPERDLEKDIKDNYLRPSSVIAGEAELIFVTEFRKPATYYSVMHALGSGKHTVSEIAIDCNMDADNVSHALEVLEGLNMIQSKHPYGKHGGKKTSYFISDNYLSSHFKFVYPRFVDLRPEQMERAYSYMKEHMPEYLGHVFEDICKEFVRDAGYWNVSSWWDKHDEIDIVADGEGVVLFAECKYRNELTDADLIDDLIRKSDKVEIPKGAKRAYTIFSKSGYTRVAEDKAKDLGIMMVSLEDVVAGKYELLVMKK